MNQTEKKSIGTRIYELRRKKGYSREYLSEQAGISAKFLYEIEKKGNGFSALTLGKLSLALDTSSDYILFGKEQDSHPETSDPQATDLIQQIQEAAHMLAKKDL